MCVVSAIHDYGNKLPGPLWDQPLVYPAFEELIKRAHEFDKAAKQPHCEDPEKTAFMEELRKKHGSELAQVKSEADKLRDEVRSLKRQLTTANADLLRLDQAFAGEQAQTQRIQDDYDSLKIAYARIAIDAALKVKVCGAGEHFTAIEIELPTGPVRFHVDNQYADLLAGLPYGLVEKGLIDSDTQGLRLTQAFNYDFDQTVIPEPVTPEKVLDIFPVEPVAPVLVGTDDSCSALVVDGGIRPAGPLSHILIGDGSGVALPNLSGAARYSPGDANTMLGGLHVNGVDIGFAGGGNYNPPGAGGGGFSYIQPAGPTGIISPNVGDPGTRVPNHSMNGGHVG